MRHRLLLPLFGLFVLVAAACAPPINLRNDDYLNDLSLVNGGDDCNAPCWRGITPGETSWSDALTILEDDSQVNNIQTQDDENSDATLLAWQEGEGPVCCQMFSSDSENVDSVFLLLAPKMTLDEVLEVYGEPAWVAGDVIDENQALMSLIYPDPSIVIYAFVAGAEGELSASSEIVGTIYMIEENMQTILDTTNLDAWDGYKTFSDYVNEEFDRTAVPTVEGEESGESEE